ncbi:protein ACCELERATED CELL DEATH 6-like [Rutidosis leptorrhynchoides]|uniref:protein ACCELERATED CELL DEATH 6-like n=1 Tax=Rutidosis leptorrhynchoides TaxID=125765 RepID=UPI003A9A24AE
MCRTLPETRSPDSDTISLSDSFSDQDQIMDIDLFRAASKGDVDSSAYTLLHVAAELGNDEIVRPIADHSPSLVFNRNLEGDTPLHVAAKSGRSSVVTFLQTGLDLVVLDSDQDLAQSSSSSSSSSREADQLLRIRNNKGNTALHEALIHSHSEVAENLVEADPQVSFYLNYEEKSPLFLAAHLGYGTCLISMLMMPSPSYERLKGNPAIHAAIHKAATKRRRTYIIDILLEKEPKFISSRDGKAWNWTPLHYAPYLGYLDGVRCLLARSISEAVQRDLFGRFPIHLASWMGHVHVVELILQFCPYPTEMISFHGENILHVAARNGKLNVVDYVLKRPELEKLINQRMKYGDTPLHLATVFMHPKIVSTLTWDKRVSLNSINNKGKTSLGIAEGRIGMAASFRETINTAKTIYHEPKVPFNIQYYKDRVNTLLLVATLVATVTFAAGFTVPGGYSSDNSGKQEGMAVFLRQDCFKLFVFSDMIAMYSSVMVVVILICLP